MRSSFLWAWLLVPMLALLPLAAQDPDGSSGSQAAPPKILLKTAEFDPLVGIPAMPRTLLDSTTNLWLVQSHALPTDEMRDAIRAAGGRILGYVPEQTYVVRMSGAAAGVVGALPSIRWVGSYQPAYRLEPELVAEHVLGAEVPVRPYYIVVADKRIDKPALAAKIRGMGGVVISDHGGGLLMEVSLNGAQLLQAATFDEVLWIDTRTAIEFDMNNARIQGGANYVESILGYRGQGIIGHVYEGLEASHPDFTITPIAVTASGVARHGHCTAGIVFGNGTSHPNARGMAPSARCYYTYRSGTPYDPVLRWNTINTVVNTRNGMFTTASWGHDRTTAYTAVSADADDLVFDHDIPWTQSQSNAGATAVPRDSRPEAWAKNVTAVGGVFHFDDSDPSNDSWYGSASVYDRGSIGFAADGRIKPDLCAYYDDILTSDLTSGGYDPARNYANFGGTSGATPIVAGHNAIAIQMFTDAVFGNTLRVPGGTRFQNRPHFTTLRALLIATANQYAFNASSTDNKREHQGWGFPSLKNMYDNRNKMLIVDETSVLKQGYSDSYIVNVTSGTPELKITMCYNDWPGNPTASYARVNDLDLVVFSPLGTVYRGNYNLKTGMYSVPGGTRDARDTTECVFVQNPMAGEWRVAVYARLVAVDSHRETRAVDADYGLVVHGGYPRSSCPVYVPDDPTEGGANIFPFGSGTNPNVNAKTQFVLRRDALGGAGALTGLSFAPNDSGVRSHQRLLVRMSHVPAGTVLSTVFAANMPAPRVVLDQNNYTWPNYADRWNDVGLERPFAYDGKSDIVVEITAWGSNFSKAVTAGMRMGSLERVYRGYWTSVPTTGVLGQGALKMKASFGCAQAWSYGTSNGPPDNTPLRIPPFVNTYSFASLTRGLYFQAPTNFRIRGLRVPDETGHGLQNVEVFRMLEPPPQFTASASGGQVFYATGVPSGQIIPTDLYFAAGEWVGILGAAGDATIMHNSYGQAAPYNTMVLGYPVTLTRFMTQNNIVATGGNQPYSGNLIGNVGRIEVYLGDELSIGSVGLPKLGSTHGISAYAALPRYPITFTLGVNNSKPLYPINLAPLFPGAYMWHDHVVTVNMSTASDGFAMMSYFVPKLSSVIGAKVYAQSWQLNPRLRTLLVASDYLRFVVGN